MEIDFGKQKGELSPSDLGESPANFIPNKSWMVTMNLLLIIAVVINSFNMILRLQFTLLTISLWNLYK